MQINAKKRGCYETMTRFSTGGKVLNLYGAFHSTVSRWKVLWRHKPLLWRQDLGEDKSKNGNGGINENCSNPLDEEFQEILMMGGLVSKPPGRQNLKQGRRLPQQSELDRGVPFPTMQLTLV